MNDFYVNDLYVNYLYVNYLYVNDLYVNDFSVNDLYVNVAGHCYDVCSLSESAALRMANMCPEDFVHHNKRFLSRVYPNRMRVDSSNYNPQDLWNCGCQIGVCLE